MYSIGIPVSGAAVNYVCIQLSGCKCVYGPHPQRFTSLLVLLTLFIYEFPTRRADHRYLPCRGPVGADMGVTVDCTHVLSPGSPSRMNTLQMRPKLCLFSSSSDF